MYMRYCTTALLEYLQSIFEIPDLDRVTYFERRLRLYWHQDSDC